jgi:Holliday junction resolvasome RuvABC endonuclease subunit
MAAQLLVPEPVYRIVSIDPGTNSLGIAVLDVNYQTGQIHVEHAFTMRVDKLATQYPVIAVLHGERVSKLYAVQKAVQKFLEGWLPDMVVSESPYLGRLAQPFAVLTECVAAIRRAVSRYRPTLTLAVMDPASVKKSVGVSGKSGDKDAMRRAVRALTNVTYSSDVVYDQLDEHAIDAIAVGYAYYLQISK